MRTAQEAWDYYKTNWMKQEDILGFIFEALAEFLPFNVVKEVLKEEASEEEWNKIIQPLTEENVIEQMRQYMEFAWGKVIDHRGISANRSVQKMMAWLLLLGDDKLVAFALNGDNYPMYGAPILFEICVKYKFPIPDDLILKNMIMGLPCSEFCEGCN